MARQDALSIMTDEDEAKLAEIYGEVIEGIHALSLADKVKVKKYQSVNAGSVECPRFVNSGFKTYGTARGNGKGDALDNRPVTINLDVHKENIEEVAYDDILKSGVVNLVEARKENHKMMGAVELDNAFFGKMVTEGTEVTEYTGTTIVEKIDEIILKLEKLSNSFINGVDRTQMDLFLDPETYSAVETYMSTIPNGSNVFTDKRFKRVDVYCNPRQTVKVIVAPKESVAQPSRLTPYGINKIDESEDYSIETYLHYGTKALMPDAIFYGDLENEEEEGGNEQGGTGENGSGNQI